MTREQTNLHPSRAYFSAMVGEALFRSGGYASKIREKIGRKRFVFLSPYFVTRLVTQRQNLRFFRITQEDFKYAFRSMKPRLR
jgi:hypothetical protein